MLVQKYSGNDEKHQAIRCLQVAEEGLAYEGYTMDKLYSIASARMGLCIAAKYMAYYAENDVAIPSPVRKLFLAAETLCRSAHLKWLK